MRGPLSLANSVSICFGSHSGLVNVSPVFILQYLYLFNINSQDTYQTALDDVVVRTLGHGSHHDGLRGNFTWSGLTSIVAGPPEAVLRPPPQLVMYDE